MKHVKYEEDDFDLDEFKISFKKKYIAPIKQRSLGLGILITLVEFALSFAVGYVLFKGGQYLIDLFIN